MLIRSSMSVKCSECMNLKGNGLKNSEIYRVGIKAYFLQFCSGAKIGLKVRFSSILVPKYVIFSILKTLLQKSSKQF